MSDYSIKVNDLKKYFKDVKAVDGVSFKVKPGSIFGMLGPNGAGKTTTIETLVGLYKRDGGEIDILGYDPDTNLTEIKKLIGVQLQSPALFPRLTVRETLRLFASFYPHSLEIDEVIARIGLQSKADNMIMNLSGGQHHRLAVGLAMISNGRVIFLDEPTTGLDPQARRQLWDVILNLKKEGATVFLTTHYMDEAERLCDDLVIIDKGKIIAQGSPLELINQYFQEKAVEFINPGFTEEEQERLNSLETAVRVNYEEETDNFIIYTKEVPMLINQLMNFGQEIGKPIEDIRVRHASLEDVFLKLTGRGIRE